MTTGEQFSAYFAKCRQAGTCQVCQLDRPFVIAELPYQELPCANMCPAKKRVRLHLHGALPHCNPLAVVRRGMRVLQVGRISRGSLLLDLQEERIERAI